MRLILKESRPQLNILITFNYLITNILITTLIVILWSLIDSNQLKSAEQFLFSFGLNLCSCLILDGLLQLLKFSNQEQ